MIKKIPSKFTYSKKIQALASCLLNHSFKKGISSCIVVMALSIMKTSTASCSFMGFHEIEYPEL